MAYKIKYHAQFTRGSRVVRLEIQQKDWTGSNKEIGDFCGLDIEVQGQQAGIETPIVKTSCHFSMVDSSDKQSTSSVKYGGWEEFYTPDSTKYRVIVKENGTAIWTGYITPDSWSDDLVYRGRINVTARDMVGHLQDFEVVEADMPAATRTERLVTISDFISAGWAKASIEMSRTIKNAASSNSYKWLTCEGVPAYNWWIDYRCMLGKNWYEAIEACLDSIGAILRWDGANGFYIASIRNASNNGKSYPASTSKDIQFINRSGHRELSPAYREIREELQYDAPEGTVEAFPESAFTTASGKTNLSKPRWHNYAKIGGTWDIWTPNRTSQKSLASGNYGNPFNDEQGDGTRYMLLAIHNPNQSSPFTYMPYAGYQQAIPGRSALSLSFEVAHVYKGTDVIASLYQDQLSYYVRWMNNAGSVQWLNGDGQWTSAETQLSYHFDATENYHKVQMDFTTPAEPGYLLILIGMINVQATRTDSFTRLGNFQLAINSSCLPSLLKVNTIYDLTQNLTLKRKPELGVVPQWITSAGSVANGLFYQADNIHPPVIQAKWNNSGTALPVPVYIHLQHIALHAKANSILTGTLRDAAGSFKWSDLWQMGARQFILLGGTLDLDTGFVNNARLIEYDNYDDVVGSITADYTMEDASEYREDNSGTIVQQGGGGGSTGTVTSVGVSVPTGLAVSGSPVTTAGTIQIRFATGYAIPTTSKQSYWDGKANAEDIPQKTSDLLNDSGFVTENTQYTLGYEQNDITLTPVGSTQKQRVQAPYANAAGTATQWDGKSIWIGSVAQYNALAVKDTHTVYFCY